MKVAIVYDRVNKYGGAERFLETILDIFPKAPIFTLVASTYLPSWSSKKKVYPTFLNWLPFFRTRHELLAPIAPLAFETHNFKEYDLIISVTSADAKSVITLPHQTHICICLTPTRYLWSGQKEYRKDPKLKFLPQFLLKYFKFVDLLLSTRPDYFIAISKEVKKRIQKYYHRESIVIYPPVDNKFFVKSPVSAKSRKYYLVVSRLVPYKKIDLVISAFNKNKQKLIIVGEGSELSVLQKQAKRNIKFVGSVRDEELKKYYQNAKAVIFPQREDFGLVPLESQASGTPVVAYNYGGAKETIIKNQTGVFFQKQTISSLNLALKKIAAKKVDYRSCIKNAKNFSVLRFKKELLSCINDVLDTSI